MEENIDIGSYMIPLDCIDFSLKQFQNTVSRSDKPRPIWSADKHDDNYYEFTVYGETTGHQEIEDSISKENNNKTPCYICNIDVPTAYIERHTKTDHHKICLNISENAVCRLQKQAVNTIFLTNTETNHYFCETCSIVTNKSAITQHLATKLHQVNEKYEETIKDFAKAFIDKGNFIKKLEKEISIMIMKDQKKSDVEKADRVDVNSNKADRVDEHPRRFDKVAENCHKADKANENSLKLDRFVAYSESRKSSISSESNLSEMSENKTALKALQDYFKHIKFSNMTVTVEHYYGKFPGVTLNYYDGTEIKSTLDNFHGFNGEGISSQCRVCRVMVGNRTEHIYTSQHMQRIQAPLTAYCIRKLDSVWYHCILCNDFLENIDVHVKNPDHISRVNQCLTRNIAAFAPSAATSKGYCKYCDVALPHGKAGKSFRKSHNKTVKHKYEKWLATEDKKLHYMMCKNNNDPYVVICIACGYSVSNHKEDIEKHINSMDHELQYKRLLDDNLVTITSNMLVHCNICLEDVLFFEIIGHINKDAHKRKASEQKNVIATEVFEANQNISQTSAEATTKLSDVESQTAVFDPTTTINNNSDTKNILGVINDDKEYIEAAKINKWKNGTSHLFKTSNDKDIKTAHRNDETASTETAANIKETCLVNVNFFKQNTDTQAVCLLCSTKVPNSEVNITEHLNGKLHTENLNLLYKDGSIIPYNKSYLCTACSTYHTLAGSLHHINTIKHQDAIKIPQNDENYTSTASLPIPSTSTHVKKETKNNAAKQNLTDLEDFKMFIKKIGTEVHCRLCGKKIPNTEVNVTDHLKGKRHHENLKNVSDNKVIPHNKSAYFCNVCSAPIPIPDILQHIQTKKHQSGMTTATETKPKAPIQQQPTSNERTDIESVDKGAFCKICSVYTGKGVSRNTHNNGIQHKRNEQAYNCPNRLKRLASHHPFVTKPNSDKTHCTICDEEVQILKIEKHILLKSHSDRLLDENLRNHTSRSLIEHLRNHEIYDHGDSNFHCRLCKISFHGRWRAEVHILGQTHLILIEKHKQTIGTSQNNASLGTTNENGIPDQLNQSTTSKILDKDKVKDIIDPLKYKTSADSERIFVKKPAIEVVASTSKQTSVNSSELDPRSEIADGDSVKFKYSLPQSKNAKGSDNGVITDSGKPDNQDRNKASAKNIPEFFEKTEKPSEIYCLFCEVIVPFNDSNIEIHVKGAKHVANIAQNYYVIEGTDNPEGVVCKICNTTVSTLRKCILEHLTSTRHKNQLETLKAKNKLVKSDKMIACKVCSVKFDVKTLTEHIKSQKHIDNLLNQPVQGQSEIPETNPKIIFNDNYVSNSFLVQLQKRDLISLLESNRDTTLKQNDVDDSKISQETDITENDVLTITDVFLRYCKCCKLFIEHNSEAAHVATQSHTDNFVQHTMEKLSNNRFRCRICLHSPQQENVLEVLAHVETNTHKFYKMYFSDSNSTKQDEATSKLNIQLTELSWSQKMFQIASPTTKDNIICCRVCKLSYKSDEEYEEHLDKSSHKIMLEVMLSANGIEYPYEIRYAFCHLCKTCETPNKLLDHIESASHRIKLLDGLKNMGKHMFNLIGHSFPQFTKTNVLKMPDEVLNHLMVLAKDNIEIFFCDVCNMNTPERFKAVHEASRSHRELVSKLEELHYNKITIDENDVCFCAPCDLNFRKDTAMIHVKSSNHIHNFSSYLKNMFV